MTKVPSILLLRLKQLCRAIADAGVGIVLLALVVTFGMLMQVVVALQEMNWQAVGLLTLVLVWSLHISRKDLVFLRSVCKNKGVFKSVLTSEYIMLLSPLVLLYGWHGKWLQILALLAASIITALAADLFPVIHMQPSKRSLSFIPQKNFEIKSRVEKNPLFFAVIYGLSFFSVFHISFFIISIVVLSTFLADIFKYFEPTAMVHWKKEFVLKKITRNIVFLTLAYLPPFLICLFFQWEFKWMAIYAMVILISVATLAICFKYARYSPLYQEMDSSNTLSFLLLLSFLPGFILITIGYAFVQYFKAKKNMAYYFG